ncbi:MAG: 50S ribosomal protein L18 [Candidatus Spechtbacterales bacterium]
MTEIRTKQRKIRHKRVRARVKGTLQRPRLYVYRSNKHMLVSLIDDTTGKVLMSFSDKNLKDKTLTGNNVEIAKKIGEEFGKEAVKQGYKRVVFDRGGYRYHGKIKALSDAARSAGLKF